MDARIQRLIRELHFDPDLIRNIRWIYHKIRTPMPQPLLYQYVMYMLNVDNLRGTETSQPESRFPHFRKSIGLYIEQLLNSGYPTSNVILFRGSGTDPGGTIHYSGWIRKFNTDQPLTESLAGSVGIPPDWIERPYQPCFLWTLFGQDSVGPSNPGYEYYDEFDGGEYFGDLGEVCQQFQDRLRRNRACDQWDVRWSPTHSVTTNILELGEDEYQERLDSGVMPTEIEQEIFTQSGVNVDHYSTTHDFFIQITHPINQHILDQIESVT